MCCKEGQCCASCNAKVTKNIFVILGVLASVAAFILMIYGAAKTYTISRTQASSSSGVDFSSILGSFLDCRSAADPYFYSSDINALIRYQHCLPQAGPVYFFIVTALLTLVTACVAAYASFKETNGSMYLAGTLVALSYLCLWVGIYIMADESNTTLVQCLPCDGRATTSEQTLINTGALFPLQGRCMDGLAGTNEAAKQFVWAVGGYYVGSALGLLAGTIYIWAMAYTFTKNAKDVEPEESGDMSLETRAQSSSQEMLATTS